jgi:Transposase DDE domain group 1
LINPINPLTKEGFRVKAKIQRQLRAAKRRITRRLDKSKLGDCSRPVLAGANLQFEMAERTRGMTYGGLGAIVLLVKRLGLAEAIDRRLHLLKIHLPYHESDHVLNLAYNALCDGTCLEDIELRRNDEVFLDALGARRIPDPTTAGDFCRRFRPSDVRTLLDVFHQMRHKVWAGQPAEFFAEAKIDVDGTLVATTGQCKAGMDIAYNGTWGYHPLVVSLANTGEVLSLVNRSGNRPSHEGAAEEIDCVLAVCFEGGFRRVLVCGDTDFTQSKHLDRWDDDSRVRFIFGVDCMGNLLTLADDLPENAWTSLDRPLRYHVKTQPRARPKNVKERIVRERGFKNIRLESEEVAEFDYRPTACKKTYRLIALRKNLRVRDEQGQLFDDYRYFFYITNDRQSTPAEIVFSANDRCDQENLHAQLKGGVRALYAPVDDLVSNGAWMTMTSLAWNLKAWLALSLAERSGAVGQKDRDAKRTVLRMEFKTFVNAFVRLPCQIVRTSRRIVYRLLGWNRQLDVFFRLVEQLQRPLQC